MYLHTYISISLLEVVDVVSSLCSFRGHAGLPATWEEALQAYPMEGGGSDTILNSDEPVIR